MSRQTPHAASNAVPTADSAANPAALGLAGRLAHAFLNSKLTPLFVVAALALGVFSVLVIPREE